MVERMRGLGRELETPREKQGKTSREYDDKGRVAVEESVDPDGSKIRHVFTYDDFGRKTAVDISKEIVYPGLAGENETWSSEGRREYAYEGTSKEPSMESYTVNGKPVSIIEYTYGADGRIAKKKTVAFDSGNPSERVEEFSYDGDRMVEKTVSKGKSAPRRRNAA